MRAIDLWRRITLGFLIATWLIVLTAAPIFACNISIKADKTTGFVGDTLKLDITMVLTHRNCPVPIADTKFITTSNIVVVGQTPWLSSGRDTFKTTLTINLIAIGPGKVEIVRECIKEGGYASIDLAVIAGGILPGSQAEPVVPSTGQTADEPFIAVSSGNDAGDDPSGSELSWVEAFERALSQPFIWAYIGLVTFAYFGLLMRRRRWRFVSLAFSMVYLGFFLGLCPCTIGAMQNLVLHFGDAKEYLAQFIILAIPVVSTVFLGRLYCGWVCPMGAVQQFLYRKDLALKLPDGIGQKVKKIRFVVLGAIMIAALYTGTTAFAEVDPFKSLFNAQIAPVPTTLLAILVIGSVFIFTPWCRFLCPMGAVLSVVGRLARRKISFSAECKSCGACSRSFCDYKAITPSKPLPLLEQHECARCGECISRCPRKALEYYEPELHADPAQAAPSLSVPELVSVVEVVRQGGSLTL
jgi:NosR/NirI family transcriptional regulator, nitrous oxide reductase regulator